MMLVPGSHIIGKNFHLVACIPSLKWQLMPRIDLAQNVTTLDTSVKVEIKVVPPKPQNSIVHTYLAREIQ